MKKLFTLLVFMAFALVIMAQAPGKMSYQALVRDSNNKLIPDSNIGMQISILQGSAEGTALYVERHFPSTNSNGLITVEIGGGTIVSGDIMGIDWANGPYFIKTETDLNGGANYTISGTSQLLSVPYALHSNTAENVITENDPVFGASAASGISTSNITNWNNKLDSEVDGSKTNELQTLSISGNNLSISSKNTVELPFLSEIPDNSVTTAKILNGTIVNEDIGNSAAISSSKINGMPGVEYTGNSSYSALPTTNTDIGSISVSCPTSGYVFIVARANPIIFGDGTRVVFGLGTSSTSQNLDEVHIGHIDGAGTDRRYYSATVMATVNVNAGTNTFYFSAYKSSFGTPDGVNLSNIRMQAIFVPLKY